MNQSEQSQPKREQINMLVPLHFDRSTRFVCEQEVDTVQMYFAFVFERFLAPCFIELLMFSRKMY